MKAAVTTWRREARTPTGSLSIYLNDHLAAATGARELARRSAASNRGSGYGSFLAQLAQEIEEDRRSLLTIMDALGVPADRVKVVAGWGAEKLGRLKLNGRLLSYSPLSRLVELELLALGVNGKLALWGSLGQLECGETVLSGLHLDELVARGTRQLEQLEAHRLLAATDALASDHRPVTC